MSNTARPERSRQSNNRLSEMIAVLLLGVATIGTAWCGYQASRWNQEQGEISRDGSDLRVEGNRQFGLATQAIVYDANLVAQYAKAVVDGDTQLQDFLRSTLFRAEFLPVVDRWQQAVQDGETPPRLLEDREYLDSQLADYQATQAEAEAKDVEAKEAGENGDDYVLLTVLLAAALFFAGVTTSFKMQMARLVLLMFATVLIAYCLSRIATLPVT
ncbi:MAG TPA: hypothetical protein VE487_03435 [Ilumatobacter sp.]|nr:hypothetical protein [Ilumatobacter sp.]